ncbi:MAG: rhodanese-like domain-containing protein [Pseudomonadota bacterium]
MKTAKDYLEEANAVVPKMAPTEAIELHKSGAALFVDVRDSGLIAQTGTIAGAERIARGMMEFTADDSMPMHNPKLKKDQKIALVCGAGGQAALAGKTLHDMGYTDVVNVGGFKDWVEADGPTEEG